VRFIPKSSAFAPDSFTVLHSTASITQLSWFDRHQRTYPMSETPSFPYATHLDIKFPALSLVDVPALVKACTDKWYNQTLCKVNDSVIRLGVVQGEYHWHKHVNDDEFFFVLEGHFVIDLEGRSVDLKQYEGFVVPRGIVHRTRAPERAVILMVETAAIVPTGDPGPELP
jgi:mannose-6-phosphate isomerase-like protein (cupin superfamily)